MRLGVFERAQKDPRASTSTRWSGRSKGVAIVTAALLGAGGSILAAAPATAAPVASTGQGRFLSGSALGLNLDDILTVTPADAVNTGGATDTDVHPLDVTALNAVNVNLGGVSTCSGTTASSPSVPSTSTPPPTPTAAPSPRPAR
ncbi:choice-of-anchor G family protein [Sphingomonas sp. LR61]